MTDEELRRKQLKAPPGEFLLKVDPQGRLNLPKLWTSYMEGEFGSKDAFVTYDQGWLKIFPHEIWMKQDETAFEQMSEEDYLAWSLTMQHYGQLVSFDGEGRVTPSQALRTAMELVKGTELVFVNYRGTMRGRVKSEFEAVQKPAEVTNTQQIKRTGGPRML